MDKSMIKGFSVGGLAMVVLGAGAVTGYKSLTKPKLAEVIAAKEVMETVVTPREHCEDIQVQHQAPVKDSNRIAGTVVGGVAGGLLGSAFGGGKGKTLATVAGAAADRGRFPQDVVGRPGRAGRVGPVVDSCAGSRSFLVWGTRVGRIILAAVDRHDLRFEVEAVRQSRCRRSPTVIASPLSETSNFR